MSRGDTGRDRGGRKRPDSHQLLDAARRFMMLRQSDQLPFVTADPLIEVSEMLAQIGNRLAGEYVQLFGTTAPLRTWAARRGKTMPNFASQPRMRVIVA